MLEIFVLGLRLLALVTALWNSSGNKALEFLLWLPKALYPDVVSAFFFSLLPLYFNALPLLKQLSHDAAVEAHALPCLLLCYFSLCHSSASAIIRPFIGLMP